MSKAYAMIDMACIEMFELIELDEKYKDMSGFFVFNLFINHLVGGAIKNGMPLERLTDVITEVYNHRIIDAAQPTSNAKH